MGRADKGDTLGLVIYGRARSRKSSFAGMVDLFTLDSLAEIDGGRGNLMTVFERLSERTGCNSRKRLEASSITRSTTDYVDRWDQRRYVAAGSATGSRIRARSSPNQSVRGKITYLEQLFLALPERTIRQNTHK